MTIFFCRECDAEGLPSRPCEFDTHDDSDEAPHVCPYAFGIKYGQPADRVTWTVKEAEP